MMGAVLTNEDRERNAAKYGAKEDDVIERAYRESKFGGDFYCYKNAEKYMRRFMGSSAKAGNRLDLVKAHDYLTRMLEHNPPTGNEQEVIEK